MSVAVPVVQSWDGENRRIYLKQGVDSFHWVTDIYTEYRYQRRIDENLRKFEPLLEALGNESKGAGRFTSRFVRLLTDGNALTTKVVPFDENSEITALGEAITDVADTDPKLFDISGITNAVVINYTPPDTEIIVTGATITEENKTDITEAVIDGINNPVIIDPLEQYNNIEEYFRQVHKHSNQTYYIKLNSDLRDTLKTELNISESDSLTQITVLGYPIILQIDPSLSGNNFIIYGIV